MISNPYQNPDTVFTTSSSPVINLNTSVTVNVNGGTPLNFVSCSVKNPQEVLIGQFLMSDNGINPDTVSGDGIYSVSVSISNIQCLLVGKYSIEYLAENNSGLFSNLITSDFRVVNSANQPPFIISASLPDSVIRPLPGDSSLLTISVNAGDPDGLCDIKDVTFVTVRPNGVTLPPIPMYNNQNGQFTFSNYVSFSSDPSSYGYFKYTFTVKDNSGVSGTRLTDSIKFIQPD